MSDIYYVSCCSKGLCRIVYWWKFIKFNAKFGFDWYFKDLQSNLHYLKLYWNIAWQYNNLFWYKKLIKNVFSEKELYKKNTQSPQIQLPIIHIDKLIAPFRPFTIFAHFMTWGYIDTIFLNMSVYSPQGKLISYIERRVENGGKLSLQQVLRGQINRWVTLLS